MNKSTRSLSSSYGHELEKMHFCNVLRCLKLRIPKSITKMYQLKDITEDLAEIENLNMSIAKKKEEEELKELERKLEKEKEEIIKLDSENRRLNTKIQKTYKLLTKRKEAISVMRKVREEEVMDFLFGDKTKMKVQRKQKRICQFKHNLDITSIIKPSTTKMNKLRVRFSETLL